MADYINIPHAGRYKIFSKLDNENANRVIDLISEHDNPFARDPIPGHITASAVIINTDASALLMTHHAKLDRWLQLGGHCDGLKDPYFVAKKEGYEESGLSYIDSITTEVLDIDIHPIPASSEAPEHLHFDIRYLFQANHRQELKISSESKQLRWIDLSTLEAVTDDRSILRLRDKIDGLVS